MPPRFGAKLTGVTSLNRLTGLAPARRDGPGRLSGSTRADTRAFGSPTHGRTRDLDEQTGLGDVYIAGLMRAQLRLSLAVLGLTFGGLAALPVVLTLVPATRTLTVLWVPFPWLALGVLVYPCAFIVVTVLAFILLGDVLRDALDPRNR